MKMSGDMISDFPSNYSVQEKTIDDVSTKHNNERSSAGFYNNDRTQLNESQMHR